MKICVDIQAAVAQGAGVGRYTRLLAENLSGIAGSDRLSFFYFDFMRRGLSSPLPGSRAVRWCPGRLAQSCWKRMDWPPYDWFAGRADVYHFTNFIIPPLSGGKKAVTIYDASFLRCPEFTESRNLAFLSAKISDTVKRADAIITISHFSAAELACFFPQARGRIHVIYPGVAQQAPPAIQNRPKMAEPPYILTVGTIEPRKNIAFLVEIFEKMRAFKGRLVIAGRLGWKYSPILERLRASPRAADIRLLENVNDGELASLYAGAEAFVFPSLYEGFGFPPLEAAACGAPVVSSAAGSLREVLGNGALLIDKYDAGQWAEAVMGIINDVSRRRALVDRGRLQAARYTWAETARKTMELYRSLA